MRPLYVLLLAAACGLSAPAAVPAAEFPYQAYVVADDVYVRSGPGANYYPTSQLRYGEVVEIYRHDPGGWYAIRPPEGSFSWVAAEYVDLDDDGIGLVNADRVVARVGSLLSDARDVIQIRLDRGEPLQVLEAKRFGSGPAAQTWFRIAPPPGEFRWISGQYVTRELPRPAERTADPSNNLLIARLGGGGIDRGGDGDAPLDDEYGRERSPRRAEQRATERRRGVDDGHQTDYDDPYDADNDFDDAAARGERERHLRVRLQGASSPADYVRDRPGSSTTRGASLDERIKSLDLRLAMIVGESPETWSLEHLRTEAEAVLLDATTPTERGRARLLLKRIGRFEEIHLRYAQLDPASRPASARGQAATASAAARPTYRAAGERVYDGVGRLTAVDASGVGQPRFALVDENGVVRSYVTAAPGLNLRHYLGYRVGITGTAGYMPEWQSRHLTARRVEIVDDAAGRYR